MSSDDQQHDPSQPEDMSNVYTLSSQSSTTHSTAKPAKAEVESNPRCDELQELTNNNVVYLFTGESVNPAEHHAQIIRIIPESNGVRMLYANTESPERLVAVPILCWALDAEGKVSGLVPWLDEILRCEEVEEKYCVSWEGYYSLTMDEIFFEPTEDVVAQLQLSRRYGTGCYQSLDIEGENIQLVQEIVDPIGTHALLAQDEDGGILLTSVISWALDERGSLHPMLADDAAIEKFPVLPGDNCLYSAYSSPQFRCLFQRDIADQIRLNNPETLEAIQQLFS